MQGTDEIVPRELRLLEEVKTAVLAAQQLNAKFAAAARQVQGGSSDDAYSELQRTKQALKDATKEVLDAAKAAGDAVGATSPSSEASDAVKVQVGSLTIGLVTTYFTAVATLAKTNSFLEEEGALFWTAVVIGVIVGILLLVAIVAQAIEKSETANCFGDELCSCFNCCHPKFHWTKWKSDDSRSCRCCALVDLTPKERQLMLGTAPKVARQWRVAAVTAFGLLMAGLQVLVTTLTTGAVPLTNSTSA